jgi:hypothetical protein
MSCVTYMEFLNFHFHLLRDHHSIIFTFSLILSSSQCCHACAWSKHATELWPQPRPKNSNVHMPQPHLGSSLVIGHCCSNLSYKKRFLLKQYSELAVVLEAAFGTKKTKLTWFHVDGMEHGWDQVWYRSLVLFSTLVVHWDVTCLSLQCTEWVHMALMLCQNMHHVISMFA